MLRGRLTAASAFVLVALSVVVGVATGAAERPTWQPVLKVPTVVDVVGPRADGRLVVAARSDCSGGTCCEGATEHAEPEERGRGLPP